MLILLTMFVTSCSTVGRNADCGPNDRPIRLSEQQINNLTDEQARAILIRNEELVSRGCAKPN